jgi:uncharacterized protein (TIGR00290 family)
VSKQPVVVSWSGGKDSALALWAVLRGNEYDVEALLTTCTLGFRRISMHGVRCSLLHQQAAAIGLPVKKVFVPKHCQNDTYERLMKAAFQTFQTLGITKVVFGDLFLADIRRYRDKLLGSIGMTGLYPLWKHDTRVLAETFIAQGFKGVVVCVDPRVLPPAFAGRKFDRALLRDLPRDVDPCGEHGEFHTFVFDGPIFRRPVRFRQGSVLEREKFVFVELAPERSNDKQ